MDTHSTPRELVFCHECEEEWYRNEHGLTCPNCHSDFCEVLEPAHDPRSEFYNQDEELRHHPHDHPDPDEEDIDRFTMGPITSTFEVNGQPIGGTTTTRSGFHDFGGPGNGGGQPDEPPNAMFNNFTTMLSGIMGITNPGETQRTTWQNPGGGGGQMSTTTYSFGNRTFTFHSSSESSNSRMGSGPGAARGGPGVGPGGDEFGQYVRGDESDAGNSANEELDRSMAGLFQALFGPAAGRNPYQTRGWAGPLHIFNPIFGGTHGDGVYTQEAFDRILTQLMEQNQSGNAPGPASATEIAALPKKNIEQNMLGENGKAECTICMDEVNVGDEVTMLYCGHWFHELCIGAWLGSHDTCPHCRMSLRESKEKAEQSGPGGSRRGEESATSSAKRSGGDRPGGSQSRRSSTMSFRRRSSTNASSSSRSNPGLGYRDGQGSGGGRGGAPPDDSNDSPGLLDRARNLFRGGS